MPRATYPAVLDPALVGTYSAVAKAGGGYVWDEVLEYRVWCHPAGGGDDYYYAYASADEALACEEREARNAEVARVEPPLALILQREYLDEARPGVYTHVKAERVTEWPLALLARPRRSPHTIPDFLAPDAPPNRLEIIRGTAPDPRRR